MKYIFSLFLFIVLFSFDAKAQYANNIDRDAVRRHIAETEAHLRFLASDELQGRRTTDPGNDVAARYIAEQFRRYGLEPVEGADEGYFQRIPFRESMPAATASIEWAGQTYEHTTDLVALSGAPFEAKVEAVFANHGWVDEESGHDDFKDIDVNGKVVVVLPGTPEDQNPYTVFRAMSKKRELASARGAVALIELYRLQFPWPYFRKYFGNPRLEVAKTDSLSAADNLPYFWLNNENEEATAQLAKGAKTEMMINSSGGEMKMKSSRNVVGLIRGENPNLQDEYVILTAHFDHVGVGKQGGGAYTAEDSIFNGARDNAIGTAALLNAAKDLAHRRPDRSVLCLAVTGEEMGLLGSKYYVDHPLVPLNQTIFNLNTDGAGYDNTDAITIIGYDRVGVEDVFDDVVQIYKMQIIADPAPEQNLFDRSDNVNFAAKGIPAPTISPGVTGFTEEVMKYYHQAIDNPEGLDYDYITRYCDVFTMIARAIANKAERPQWKAGDKYEAAAKELYGDQ